MLESSEKSELESEEDSEVVELFSSSSLFLSLWAFVRSDVSLNVYQPPPPHSTILRKTLLPLVESM